MATLRGSKRPWFGCILVSVYIAVIKRSPKPTREGSFALAHVVKPIIEGSRAATLRAEPSKGRGETLLMAASLGLLGLFPYTAQDRPSGVAQSTVD